MIYDESLSGDLTLNQNIGNFVLGTNTILGSNNYKRVDGKQVDIDTDSFLMDLLDGYSIESMSAEITYLYESDGKLTTRFSQLNFPATNIIYQVDMISGFVYIDSLPARAAGEYQISTGGGAASVGDNAELIWNWKIDIEVTKVPEPGTLALFGIGLAGMGLARRRKASA